MTAPLAGFESWPSSCTESPSESIPVRAMRTRTVSPAVTRAIVGSGTGALFVAATFCRTEIVTSAWSTCPSGADTS